MRTILRPQEILLLRLGQPVGMCNGGSSKSDSSTSSSTENTNYVNTEDRRVVASDAAIGLTGNGNIASRTESTTFTDSSNRSTNFSDSSNRSTNFADSSNRSTNFADSSQRDSNNSTSITTTDFGSVSKALESVTMMGTAATDLADSSVTGAIDALKRFADNSLTATNKAFELARGTSADSVRTVETVAAFANKNAGLAREAFAEAEFGPDQSKNVMYAALAAISIAAVAFAFKKG